MHVVKKVQNIQKCFYVRSQFVSKTQMNGVTIQKICLCCASYQITSFSIYLCSPYCMVHSIMMGNKQRINNSDANISLAYLPHRKTTTIYLLLILYYSLKTRNMICSLEIHVTKISQCFNGFYTL